MTREELQSLFASRILPENRDPYHFEENNQANTRIKSYNPLCGDKYELDIHIDQNVVKSAHFHGMGCALSKASTSILLRYIEGMKVDRTRSFCRQFLDAVHGDTKRPEEGDLKILVELRNFEGRLDCIKLSWEAMLHYLERT